jgi:hypothetical protein
MTIATVLFLAVRALHVLVAALWIGSTVFMAMMLSPAIERAGASGGQVMLRISQRGISLYMGLIALTTLGTGLYLFYRFTGGFDHGVSMSHAGLAFGCGGLAGISAGIVGGGSVGRSAAKIVAIMTQAMGMTDGPAKGALLQQVGLLKQRVRTGTAIAIALQGTALVLMAVGHYV